MSIGLLCVFCLFVSGRAITVLRPGSADLFQETSDGSQLRYRLESLSDQAMYEAVVSYAADQPALFRLSIENEMRTDRSLLNTEKLIFQGGQALHLLVQVQSDGLANPSSRRQQSTVRFWIRLDQVYLGGIPHRSLPIISTIAVTIVGVCAWLALRAR